MSGRGAHGLFGSTYLLTGVEAAGVPPVAGFTELVAPDLGVASVLLWCFFTTFFESVWPVAGAAVELVVVELVGAAGAGVAGVCAAIKLTAVSIIEVKIRVFIFFLLLYSLGGCITLTRSILRPNGFNNHNPRRRALDTLWG
jgi:hypothetical protein